MSSKNNVFLFTGQEKFLLYKELKKRKDLFKQKYGESNVFEFKSDEVDTSEVVNTIFGGGLFVSKKLVVVYGFPKDSSTENKIPDDKYNKLETKILDNLDNIGEDTVLVFVSFTPDKRKRGYKVISTNAVLKEFNPVKEKDVKQYLKDNMGDKISEEELNYFLEVVGTDMFSVDNEMKKLLSYAEYHQKNITKEMIDEVTFFHKEVNAFDILDNMLSNKPKALKLIDGLEKEGEDQFKFLGMLYWGLRAWIQIIDQYKQGENSVKSLASKLGLHPFVVSKNIKIIDKLIEKENIIKNMFKKLIYIDYNIKTGKLPAELFWLEIKRVVYDDKYKLVKS